MSGCRSLREVVSAIAGAVVRSDATTVRRAGSGLDLRTRVWARSKTADDACGSRYCERTSLCDDRRSGGSLPAKQPGDELSRSDSEAALCRWPLATGFDQQANAMMCDLLTEAAEPAVRFDP